MSKIEKLKTLTSPISYSDEFAKFVEYLPEYYQNLFDLETNLADHVSYLDIAKEDTTKISYLTLSKILANDKLFVYKNSFSNLKSFNELKDEDADFLNYVITNAYYPNHKIMAKPGRVFKSVFPHLCDKDIEALSVKFKTFILKEYKTGEYTKNFKLVHGLDIVHYYNTDVYADCEGGDLYSSCMRSMSSVILDLYVNNSQVQLAILLDDDEKVRARGLVWDEKYFDRVYGVSYTAERELIAILSSKYSDIWKGRTFLSTTNETKVVVKLDKADFEYYPFLDSLFLLNIETKELSNSLSIYPTHCLDGTGGEYSTVEDSGGYHISNNSKLACYFGSSRCSVCDEYSELIVTEEGAEVCEDCAMTCYYSNIVSTEDYMYTCYRGRYLHASEAIPLNNGNYAWVNDSNVFEINDNYYLETEISQSEIDDEYYPNDELAHYKVGNQIYYCTKEQYETLLEEHEQNV